MKRLVASVAGLGLALALAASGQPAQPESPLKTPKDKLSYGMGVNIAKSLKVQGVDIDPDLLVLGLKDAMAGAPPKMTEAEINEIMMQTQKSVSARMAETMRLAGEKNKKEGEAFLEANKAKPGVQVLPGGLQYKILVEGSGSKPKLGQTVSVQYRGTLIDGREFDSTARRGGQPAQLKLTPEGLIRGWVEALQLMPAGSKWQIVVPPALGYGERGSPPAGIGPNAVLIFEIELVSVQ
jgi:FKBP-type peptidyl-prolyl cis-trans isomerase